MYKKVSCSKFLCSNKIETRIFHMPFQPSVLDILSHLCNMLVCPKAKANSVMNIWNKSICSKKSITFRHYTLQIKLTITIIIMCEVFERVLSNPQALKVIVTEPPVM